MPDKKPLSANKAFHPRREAHSMKPEEILPPIRAAVTHLLTSIDGVVSASAREVASCFLVSGERGSGKTTVLLTAANVCAPHSTGTDPLRTAFGELRKRVRWLEPLDVEPMHADADFLTTLLIRVRDTLDHRQEHRSHRASLLEDRTTSAYDEINGLINDSALIWEDIEENTTRERAHRQVAAAECFVGFRERLARALEAVCATLAEQEDGESPVLIVPIDNIDRSAEHLRAIFKLANLVGHPHLLLVLAGDRIDLNVFLERSYGSELTRAADGWLDPGPGGDGKDETLSIARRQAAASMRKVIPPGHRIEVDPVSAEQALAFRLAPDLPSLAALLAAIRVPPTFGTPPAAGGEPPSTEAAGVEPPPSTEWEPTSLLELLALAVDTRDMRTPGEPDAPPPRPRLPGKVSTPIGPRRSQPVLAEGSEGSITGVSTPIGQQTLRLPARALLDFWLRLYSEANLTPNPANDHDCPDPARVARSMLRLSLAESDLPHWATNLVQDRIIGRASDRSTQIFLSSPDRQPYVHAHRMRAFEASFPGVSRTSAFESAAIELRRTHRFVVRVRADATRSIELPANASAWLLVLHDLLVYDPRPAVIGQPPRLLDECGPSVVTAWRGWRPDAEPLRIALAWPRLALPTFFDHTLTDLAWTDLLRAMESVGYRAPFAGDDADATPQFLALTWIDIMLWIGDDALHPWKSDRHAPPGDRAALDAYAGAVLARAWAALQALDRVFTRVFAAPRAAEVRHKALYDWLLLDLPLFFTGDLDTRLAYETHCPEALRVFWDRTENRTRIARHRAERLRRSLEEALTPQAAGGDAAASASLPALLRQYAGEFDALLPAAARGMAMGPVLTGAGG